MRTRNYSAIIEPGELGCGSRKKTSSIDDVIRRSDQPGQGPGNSSSRDTRRSDKDSVKGDETGPRIVKSQSKSVSSSSSSTSSTTRERQKRRKSRRKHRHRNSAPCCCPMYEVEVIKTTGAEALRGKQGPLPGSQPGMQIVNTETVAKRLYTYNMGTGLPEGMQMSPRGELIENQGVSAENGAYDNMQPYGAQPTYQTPFGRPYTQPQRRQLTYPPQNQKGAPAEPYMPIQQPQISNHGGRTAIMQVSSYEMLPLIKASPPLVSQNVRGQTRMIRPPLKVDSIVFQCMCGHDQGKRKSSTTTTTNTSSTTSPTNSSTKTTKTSSSSRKKARKSSASTTTTKRGSKKKGNKSSTSSTSTKTSQKNNGNKTSTSSTSTKTSQNKNGNKSSTSSTITRTSQKKKEKSSSSSSSSSSSNATSTNSSSTLKKKQCKSGLVQVQIHCDTCGHRKTYLVCIACYNLHKITTCKDCKAAAVSGYPSQNALVRVAGQMVAYRPALPPPSPPQQTHQPQQQLQLYGADDIVGALSNANGALIVCCSSKTMLPLNNADGYHDPGTACEQRPIMTNFVLGIVNPSGIKKNSSSSSSTNSTTPSSNIPVKSRSNSRTRSRNTEEQYRGSSLCKCGHDSRTCPVCSERRHMH